MKTRICLGKNVDVENLELEIFSFLSSKLIRADFGERKYKIDDGQRRPAQVQAKRPKQTIRFIAATHTQREHGLTTVVPIFTKCGNC